MSIKRRTKKKAKDEEVKETAKKSSWRNKAEKLKEAEPEKTDIEVYKLEKKDQKGRIGFPLTDENGDVVMIKVVYFKTKFKQTLADGKWHSFVAPEHNPELMAMCEAHPMLEKKVERVTPIIVYETDRKGKVIGDSYDIMALKINNPRLIELQEIDEEDNLAEVDVRVSLNPSKDVKFQEMRFKALKDCLWRDKLDTEEIVKEVEAYADSGKLENVLAFTYDDDKIEALVSDEEYDEDEEEYEDDEVTEEDIDEEEYEDDNIDDEEEEEPAPKKRARKRRR